MDVNTNFQNFDQTFFSMWDYSGLIQQLESMYCVCIPDQTYILEQLYPYFSYGQFGGDFCMPEAMNTTSGYLQGQSLIDQSSYFPKRDDTINQTSQPENTLRDNENEEIKETTMNGGGIVKREGRSTKLNIKPGLIRMRKRLLDQKISGFSKKVKKTRYTADKYLGRRSKYIGVSKNNIHWQALINVNYSKKYIGTFLDEIEAARTYDLYSIATQGECAPLNFDYTAQEMLEAIEYYLEYNIAKVDY